MSRPASGSWNRSTTPNAKSPANTEPEGRPRRHDALGPWAHASAAARGRVHGCVPEIRPATSAHRPHRRHGRGEYRRRRPDRQPAGKQHDRDADRLASVVVCASPAYLAARGRPQTPDQIRDHDCIAINPIVVLRPWRFRKGKRELVVPIQSRLCVNTSEAAVLAAVAGAGLTRVMSYKMDAAKRAGTLELVLEAFEAGTVAGPHRVFAAQAGPAETPRLPKLGDAAPQSPTRLRQGRELIRPVSGQQVGSRFTRARTSRFSNTF